MKKRILTGLVLLAILGPAAYFGGIYFLICGIFLTACAAYEMMSMFFKKYPSLKFLKYVVPVMCVFLLLVIYLSSTRGLDSSIFGIRLGRGGITLVEGEISVEEVRRKLLFYCWVLVSFVLCIIACFTIVLFKKDSNAEEMMSCATTLVYCGILMGIGICVEYIQPIADIPVLPSEQFGGRSFVFICTICMSNDIVAYFFGSKYGKKKLCPGISPNKTVEGAIAGLIASSILGTIVAIIPWRYTLFDLSVFSTSYSKFICLLVVFIFSLFVSIFGIFGDLIASKYKRTFEIKDFGHIFPGHGGVLDRFDSLIFASVFYAITLQIFQLIMIGVSI